MEVGIGTFAGRFAIGDWGAGLRRWLEGYSPAGIGLYLSGDVACSLLLGIGTSVKAASPSLWMDGWCLSLSLVGGELGKLELFLIIVA